MDDCLAKDLENNLDKNITKVQVSLPMTMQCPYCGLFGSLFYTIWDITLHEKKKFGASYESYITCLNCEVEMYMEATPGQESKIERIF